FCRGGTCTEIMISPCANSCPANVDLPGTIALLQMKKYTDALALGREANPLFLTCGYVCEEPPCQKNCKRLTFDDPVYSQSLHRYAGDKASQSAGSLAKALNHPTIKAGAVSGKKVAIVGAGPAGLAAAQHLARLGHKVTVYDQMTAAGGMAAYGIPVYRLPREILSAEAAAITSLGVIFEFGKKLGLDINLTSLKSENDAVLVAVGAWQSRRISIPGEELPGVVGAVDFLRHAALSEPLPVGKRVLVVGGGNVAIDCARTARRLGATAVTMICVEDDFEMPATLHEIESAHEEGIEVKVMAVPTMISKSAEALKVLYSTIAPGPYDLLGRRWPPTPDKSGQSELIVDTVIVAIGQAVDFSGLEGVVERRGPFVATNDSRATTLAGVFAAGDCAEPANSVVKAVAAGKAAALAIDQYLTGTSHNLSSPLRSQLGCFVGDYTCQVAARVEMPEQDVASRTENFALVELGLDDSKAAYEMLRCICAAKGGKTG
ncbi:MAG: FAD-dependent oxidoreductase, partial [Betaproteobacteria bacterium]